MSKSTSDAEGRSEDGVEACGLFWKLGGSSAWASYVG